MNRDNLIISIKNSDLASNLVLKIDVAYSSSIKLVLKDENGAVIKGSDCISPEVHKFRFETE